MGEAPHWAIVLSNGTAVTAQIHTKLRQRETQQACIARGIPTPSRPTAAALLSVLSFEKSASAVASVSLYMHWKASGAVAWSRRRILVQRGCCRIRASLPCFSARTRARELSSASPRCHPQPLEPNGYSLAYACHLGRHLSHLCRISARLHCDAAKGGVCGSGRMAEAGVCVSSPCFFRVSERGKARGEKGRRRVCARAFVHACTCSFRHIDKHDFTSTILHRPFLPGGSVHATPRRPSAGAQQRALTNRRATQGPISPSRRWVPVPCSSP